MNYLTSLGLDPESGEIFTALELVQAPNFGEITRKGFVDGWKEAVYVPSAPSRSPKTLSSVGIRRLWLTKP